VSERGRKKEREKEIQGYKMWEIRKMRKRKRKEKYDDE
jgi:hypothetical protein